MSILCCFRGRQPTHEEPDRGLVELPTHPPAVKLTKSPLPTSEAELPSSPSIVVTQPLSLLHNQIPEATVDPTILEVEDSDDDEPAQSIRNSSTGTLEAIRTKFIRRLSEGSGSKRHSQQYLGTSDEEIARRAELKRLMHKRIKEELKSEEEQDEEADTKMSTIDESKPVSPTRVELPGGGPRDNIEFSVSGVSETGSRDCVHGSLDVIFLALPPSDSQLAVSRRRSSYSSPSSTSQSHEDPVPKNPLTLKERASLPQLPSSPQLVPIHLPSIPSSQSLCSWRLSYSTEQVTAYLDVPGELKPVTHSEHTETDVQKEETNEQTGEQVGCVNTRSSDDQTSRTNIELAEDLCRQQPLPNHSPQHDQGNTETLEDLCAEISLDTDSGVDSPLDLWLRSQELQSSSAVSSRRTSDMILQMIPDSFGSRLHQSGDIDESVLLGGVRNVSNSSPAAPHGPLGDWPTSYDPQGDTGIDVAELTSTEPKERQRSISDPSDAFGDVDLARKISSSHYASSRYTTRPDSCQTVAKESRLSLVELLGGRKAISPFSNFSRLISPSRSTDAEKSKSDVSSYKTAHNEASALDITLSKVRSEQHQIDEIGSIVFSDTASFKHREAELKSVEKRFGHFQSRRDITIPIVSKFREEFTEPQASAATKVSIFAKFHLPIPKRVKHTAKDKRGYSIRGVNSRSVEDLGSAISHLRQQDSKKAIIDEQLVISSDSGQERLDVENALGQRQHTISHEDILDFQQHRRNSKEEPIDPERAVSNNKISYVTGVLDSQSRVEHGHTLKPPSRPEYDRSPSQQSDISNSVLREWVNLMNDEDVQALEPKPEPQSRSPLRFKTPPASWAKWPSHTRHERTGPAGERDDVIPRDFAVRVGSNGSGTSWLTDKPNDSSKRYVIPEARSLSVQVGKVVKGSLNKVVQGSLNRDRRASAESDRGYQKSHGHLEYPELEILPMNGGYKELQALERQIDNMKRGSVVAESQLALSSSDNTRPPLSARLASEVHMIQHKVSRESCQDDEDAATIPSAALPVTPRQVLLAPQGAPEGNDDVETPESQVSYEDCVPKHMLEDEKSLEDSKVTEHGHNTQTV
ncbi:hypothetical protein F4818DRAFT_451155 [Hypoxylon cercidicola]|nr:hypothetical protein F4818DRAFT_451155 [Hypoxylon cercidicola]